ARLRFVYDDGGRLERVVDANGRITRIERDGLGYPTAIVGPYGQTTSLAVDAAGWLAEVTDPAGRVVRFEYGIGGLLTRSTDPSGFESTYEYDAWGSLVRAVDREGNAKTLTGSRTRTRSVSSITTALGRTTRYEIERDEENGGSIWKTRKPSGAEVTAVAGADAVDTVTYPDGTTIERALLPDALHGMQAPIARYRIDAPGGVDTEVTIAQTPTYVGDAGARTLATLDEIIAIDGREISSRYDAETGLRTVTTPAGRQSTTTSDAFGRPLTVRLGALAPVAYTYDDDGRVASVTVGTGAYARNVTLAYGDDGLVESITDPLGRMQSFGYDAAGRVTRRTLV